MAAGMLGAVTGGMDVYHFCSITRQDPVSKRVLSRPKRSRERIDDPEVVTQKPPHASPQTNEDSVQEATSDTSTALTPVHIVHYDEALHLELWDAFVRRSMNGTAFHFQQFLRYHSAGKFNFEHLLFYQGDRLVALLPGAITQNGEAYESPMGSSYGSFVVEDISADTALSIVEAFKGYLRERGFKRAFLTAPPVIYQPVLTQNLDFSLLYKGFSYQRHYISHAIDLRHPGKPFDRFQPTARKFIRRTYKQYPDVHIREFSRDDIEEGLRLFNPILLENKAKYNAKPTHTLEDLLRLNELMPDLMKLFLVYKGDQPIAGSLLFIANARVAIIFYHMLYYEYKELRPIYLLMDKVTTWAKENGFSFIDIGVSQDTSDDNPMTPALSLIRFKEKFDSRGVLRSTMSIEL
jgi:hypothetical protein